MIAVFETKSGHNALTYNSKLLCSRTNPEKEASRWFERIQENNNFKNYDTILLMGLGAGFHLLEIIKQLPSHRIICIETNKHIFDYHSKFPNINFSKVYFFNVCHPVELVSQKDFFSLIANNIIVIENPNVVSLDKENYSGIKNFILGRSAKGAEQLIYSNFATKLNFEEYEMQEGELISIKHVDKALENYNGKKSKLFCLAQKVLMELVK